MIRHLRKILLSTLFSLVLLLQSTTLPATAVEMLPQSDPNFKGKIGITYQQSQADTGLLQPIKAKEDAPNILLVLIDDAGFGSASTFGGSIATPTFDKLAKNGLRYNRFHTTALCSPTRAALLTGRNHHSVSSGTIQELATGYPGYTGLIPQSTATVGQILQESGYSTAWFGKNHNVPDNQTSNVGPFDRWPNGLGFDYFYGFIGGETDQWYPTLYENQNPVEQTSFPEDGYNLTHDLADKAIAWIRYKESIAPDRPFFAYFAPGAVHAPHQPPQAYIDKYKGKFDRGWDKEREVIFERQQKLGVIPATAKLTARPDAMPAWDSFSPEDQKILARQMETYAGFLEYTDTEVGRVVDTIDELGDLDNTLIIYINGDNGSSAEGSLIGTCNELLNLNGFNLTMEDNRRCYDIWGGPETSPHFAVSWAWAMDTPFRWTKQVASYFGGTRNATVMSWPAKIKDTNKTRDQFHHVIDIAPTLLEVAGIDEPRFHKGIAQKPIEGVSMAYTFGSGGDKAQERHQTQYFEMFGHRAIYDNGWMASAFHDRLPWVTAGTTVPFDKDKWELFNLDEDFTQSTDLSDQYPEKLTELKRLFFLEGARYNVFPLDDRFAERTDVSIRPSFTFGRNHFDLFPGMVHISEGSAPNVKNKSHSITADLNIPEGGAEGVILAMGGTTSGYTLYIKDSKLAYDYNWFDLDRTSLVSSTTLPTGKVKVRFDFNYDGGVGKGGTGTLYVNNRKVAQERIEKTVPGRYGVDTMDVGMDLQAPVSDKYQPPYKFTGEIEKVTIDIK